MSERDIIARELADKIRKHPWSNGCAQGCCVDDERGAHQAADLIDPWPGAELPEGWQDMLRAAWQLAHGADGTVVGFMTQMGDEP